MRIKNPLDFVIVDRNCLLDTILHDKASSLYQAEDRLEVLRRILVSLLEELPGLSHGFPDLDSRGFREGLESVIGAVERCTEPVDLAQFGERLCRRVRQYGAEHERIFQAREEEVRRILGIVCTSIHRSTAGSRDFIGEVEGFVERFRQASRIEDLRQLRSELGRNLARLSEAAAQAAQELEPSVAVLREIEELRTRLSEVEAAANRDALTGVYNRRAFDAHVSSLLFGGRAFTLVLCDLNRFKDINDTYGHPRDLSQEKVEQE